MFTQRAIQVADVPAVFAMDAAIYAGCRRNELAVQGSEISRVDDRGAQLTKQSIESEIAANILPGLFLEIKYPDARLRYSI